MKKIILSTISIIFIAGIVFAGLHLGMTGAVKKKVKELDEKIKNETWDIDDLEIPKFVSTNYIELNKINRISKFRSGVGHDYSDGVESNRSMKHYFERKSSVSWSTIQVFSPINGTVVKVFQERTAGIQVWIKSAEYSAFQFNIFHITLANPLSEGDTVTAGQLLGTHAYEGSSDIAVWVNTPKTGRLISYFYTLTDSLFQIYQTRGIATRDTMVIPKEYRDAHPITDWSTENPNDWVTLQ